jgi:hypothetical protein
MSRTLVLSVSLFGLSLGGSAFAAGSTSSSSKMKLAKAPVPNCDVDGKKHHYKTKEACEKKKGKWLGDEANNPAGAASATTPTSAATPPTSGTAPSMPADTTKK